ncbi:MAG: hypothetical protein HUU08_17390 [Candidatus Brocadia sp.]|nr:hypothetical protein [Candidatus Brocadia sp.]UJS18239.1 MAG: DUF6516 family protein [Candidatus Jettenia sp.]
MKSKLIRHIKVREDTGNIVEVKLWQVNPSIDKPHGYKYSLVYIVKGKRVIGYDNAEGKGDHRHYRDKEEVYAFKSIDKLFEDFYNDIKRVKKYES